MDWFGTWLQCWRRFGLITLRNLLIPKDWESWEQWDNTNEDFYIEGHRISNRNRYRGKTQLESTSSEKIRANVFPVQNLGEMCCSVYAVAKVNNNSPILAHSHKCRFLASHSLQTMFSLAFPILSEQMLSVPLNSPAAPSIAPLQAPATLNWKPFSPPVTYGSGG